MRLHIRLVLLAVVAAGAALLAAAPARAQEPVRVEGTVTTKDASGKATPVANATVDFYRTDIGNSKGKSTTTDKNGKYVMLMPVNATVTVVISGTGYQPQYRSGIPAGLGRPIDFELVAGNGNRPTLDDIKKAANGPVVSEADRKAAEEAASKAKEEHDKAVAAKGLFDEKKAHFDAGVAAATSKDYRTAVTELTAALDGLDNADPKFFNELIEKSSGNLAEAQYQIAVDAYNQKNKDEAKDRLEKAALAINRALSLNPTDTVYYSIQGKILFLLVDKFSETDKTDAAVNAFTKAADAQIDPKAKAESLMKVGDVYRVSYQSGPAIDAYKKALAIDPDNAQILYMIGLAGMASADADPKPFYQIAADYFAAFLKKAPTDPHAKDIQDTLATLKTNFKISPRPLK